MKIVIDKHIPFIEETIGSQPFSDVFVRYLEPEAITHDVLKEIDALIIRTRNKISEDLLQGTKVRFIASATIGLDHVDTDYCVKEGIYCTACPGCNSHAVCDYVEEVLNTFSEILPSRPTIGIIGHGHIGTLVDNMAKKRKCRVLFNDAPKQLGVPIKKITRECDIITFHVPLNKSLTYPTYHLCDKNFIDSCKTGVILINSSRGGIMDESAVLTGIKEEKIGGIAIDCWENEPYINTQFLKIDIPHIFSYHIAGYSLQGKFNASQMCLNSLCAYYELPNLSIDKNLLNLRRGDSLPGWLSRITTQLVSSPAEFENLRKRYTLR